MVTSLPAKYVYVCVYCFVNSVIYVFKMWKAESLQSRPVTVQNTGETSDITAVQMLVIIVCVCPEDEEWGWWWVHLDACRWALPFLYWSMEAERERACVRVTHTHTHIHTLEPQLRHTDLSMSKNGKHSCCCWEDTRSFCMSREYMQGFI